MLSSTSSRTLLPLKVFPCWSGQYFVLSSTIQNKTAQWNKCAGSFRCSGLIVLLSREVLFDYLISGRVAWRGVVLVLTGQPPLATGQPPLMPSPSWSSSSSLPVWASPSSSWSSVASTWGSGSAARAATSKLGTAWPTATLGSTDEQGQ